MRLMGKTAIVTGGANGIGRATVMFFAREGAQVVVADRDAEAGRECTDLVSSEGSEALFSETDVGSHDEVVRLIDATLTHYGGLDILVNSAGIALRGSVVQTEPERWNRVLDVNLAGIYHCCRCAIPHMIARGGGSIVNIASLQGMFGWPSYAAYAASKAGIIGLTRQVAVEYRAEGIRSNSVSPGGVTTHLGENTARLESGFTMEAEGPPTTSANADTPSADPKPSSAQLPPADQQPQLLSPALSEDIAYAVLFLASDESAHVSGHNLVVDGGASARGSS